MRGVATAAVVLLPLVVIGGRLERYPRPDHGDMGGAVTFGLLPPQVTDVSSSPPPWDAVWTIRRIFNSYLDEDDPADRYWWEDIRIKWAELRIEPLNGSSKGERYPLADFSDNEGGGDLAFWYEDVADPNNAPDVDGRFRKTGLDESHGGLLFAVVYVGEWNGGLERLCTLWVPQDLP